MAQPPDRSAEPSSSRASRPTKVGEQPVDLVRGLAHNAPVRRSADGTGSGRSVSGVLQHADRPAQQCPSATPTGGFRYQEVMDFGTLADRAGHRDGMTAGLLGVAGGMRSAATRAVPTGPPKPGEGPAPRTRRTAGSAGDRVRHHGRGALSDGVRRQGGSRLFRHRDHASQAGLPLAPDDLPHGRVLTPATAIGDVPLRTVCGPGLPHRDHARLRTAPFWRAPREGAVAADAG